MVYTYTVLIAQRWLKKRMTERKLTDEQVHQLAADLIGTCDSLDDALSEFGITFEELTTDDCFAIDECFRLCDGCNWWVEPEEITETGACWECEADGSEV